jgi:hypothetical protein
MGGSQSGRKTCPETILSPRRLVRQTATIFKKEAVIKDAIEFFAEL